MHYAKARGVADIRQTLWQFSATSMASASGPIRAGTVWT